MGESDCDPSLKLSSILLNEQNYVLWSQAVTLSLGSKKKLGFINGKSVWPQTAFASKTPDTTNVGPSDTAYDDWLSSDQLVRWLLLNSMELLTFLPSPPLRRYYGTLLQA